MTHVAICCDAGPKHRREHLMRCLGLAEELATRGVTVAFVCDAEGEDWAQLQLRARGIEWTPPVDSPEEFVKLLARLEADAAVFDSVTLAGDVCAAVTSSGLPTLAVVDGDRDGDAADAAADVVVVPDVGAEEAPAARDIKGARGRSRTAAPTVLAGLDFAPMRNDVLANRPVRPPRRDGVEVPRVMALFDGPHGPDPCQPSGAAAVARALAESGRPFEATFVLGDPEASEAVTAVRPAPRQRFDVTAPSWRLYDRLARSDVVLGAAGPPTYEWLCMGASVGLVWVSDDQVDRYRRLMVHRAVVGLGSASELAAGSASGVEKMTRLLSDARERARLGESAWRLVDGLGRARVVDALLDLLGTGQPS